MEPVVSFWMKTPASSWQLDCSALAMYLPLRTQPRAKVGNSSGTVTDREERKGDDAINCGQIVAHDHDALKEMWDQAIVNLGRSLPFLQVDSLHGRKRGRLRIHKSGLVPDQNGCHVPRFCLFWAVRAAKG